MDLLTRREMIVGTSLVAGAVLTGCSDPFREKPNMLYRELGKTGLRVSVVGFGTEWMERQSQETCTAIMRRCEEKGVGITVMKAYAGGRLFDAARRRSVSSRTSAAWWPISSRRTTRARASCSTWAT